MNVFTDMLDIYADTFNKQFGCQDGEVEQPMKYFASREFGYDNVMLATRSPISNIMDPNIKEELNEKYLRPSVLTTYTMDLIGCPVCFSTCGEDDWQGGSTQAGEVCFTDKIQEKINEEQTKILIVIKQVENDTINHINIESYNGKTLKGWTLVPSFIKEIGIKRGFQISTGQTLDNLDKQEPIRTISDNSNIPVILLEIRKDMLDMEDGKDFKRVLNFLKEVLTNLNFLSWEYECPVG